MSANKSSYSYASTFNSEAGNERSSVTSIPEKSARRCTLSGRAARVLEVAILTLVIVCVGGLLSLPSALYFVRQASISSSNIDNTSMVPALINMSDCGEYNPANSSACSSLIWGVENSSCDPEPYTGSVCSSQLLAWQDCAVGQLKSGIIAVNASLNQDELEQQATEILQVIDDLASPACQQDAVPFICLYGFPLCSCFVQQLILPTKEECERISTTTCRAEFNLAVRFGYGDLLPDCSQLPSSSDNTTGDGSSSNSLTFNGSNVTCSPDFYLENSTCFPVCQEWNQYSDTVSALVIYSAAVSASVGILGSIAVYVGSFIRYRSMLVLPSVFIVYLTTGMFLIAFSVLLAVIDINLFCSSKDLINSLENPTVYCIISGVITQYFIVNASIWWLFHLLSIFYKVMFPLTAMRWKKKDKYIHLLLLILGLLLPLPSVIYTLTQDNYGYTLVNFPPRFCGPRNTDVIFYAIMLVVNIILVIGFPILIILSWTLHKNQITSSYKKGIWKLSTAETKILLVLCYYAIFGIVALSYFSVASADQDQFIAAVQQYFVCEAAGSGEECDRSQIEQFNYAGLVTATYVLLGLIPSVNLIFVINWGNAKGFCQVIWSRCFQCRSSSRVGNKKNESKETVLAQSENSL